ncbi:MAG: hypothetical protein NZM25_10345 [Leptospiraceae bacterium]|nr:hypothetical protein [Leptospiraceae bacterium]MDW8305826.1 NAD(P)-dependent oxidoreductase [Leptospiraceae bacterium]
MVHKILMQEGIPLPPEYRQALPPLIFFNPEEKERIFARHADADCLIVRANCWLCAKDLSLLPRLKTLGLISTGKDNLPLSYIQEQKIDLYSAEGVNSFAVFEYCVQAIFHWVREHPSEISSGIGIIGRGRIGSLLYRYLQKIELPTRWYDPFLEGSHTLAHVLETGLVSLHVPLTQEGPYPTENMIHSAILPMNPPRIMNTSRGRVIEAQTLRWLGQKNRIWAQDVYPQEPPTEIIPARFSTPHIAGYSTRGRLGGVEKVLREIFPFLGPVKYPQGELWFLSEEAQLFAQDPTQFTKRRDNFPYRKEFFEYTEEDKKRFEEHFAGLPHHYFSQLWHYVESLRESLGNYGYSR